MLSLSPSLDIIYLLQMKGSIKIKDFNLNHKYSIVNNAMK